MYDQVEFFREQYAEQAPNREPIDVDPDEAWPWIDDPIPY